MTLSLVAFQRVVKAKNKLMKQVKNIDQHQLLETLKRNFDVLSQESMGLETSTSTITPAISSSTTRKVKPKHRVSNGKPLNLSFHASWRPV